VDDAVKRDAQEFRAKLADLRTTYERFPAYQEVLDSPELIWKASRDVAYRVFFADHRTTWTAQIRAMAEEVRARVIREFEAPVGGGSGLSLRAVLAATRPERREPVRPAVLDELGTLMRDLDKTAAAACARAAAIRPGPDRHRGPKKVPEPLRFSAYEVARLLYRAHPTHPSTPRAEVVVRDTWFVLHAGGWDVSLSAVRSAIAREHRAQTHRPA
jgi:hypothetical protein